MITRGRIIAAIGRANAQPEHEHKEVDVVFAEDVADEILKLDLSTCTRCPELEAQLHKRLKKSVVHADRIEQLEKKVAHQEMQLEGYQSRVDIMQTRIDRAQQAATATLFTVRRIRNKYGKTG